VSTADPRPLMPRRQRRGPGGAIASLLVHLLLLALLLGTIEHDWESASARGARFEPARGGGGGGGGGYIALPDLPKADRPAPIPQTRPTPPPEAAVPVEVPTTVPPPVPDSTPAATPAAVAPSSSAEAGAGPGTGGGAGGGAGTGVGPGTGAGTGPGTGGGGAGGAGRKAESKRLILPPMESAPKELRGQPIAVTFWVSTTGKVMRLEVLPEIRDKGYARKFAEVMRDYEFRPARGPDGAPVVDTVTVVVIIN
jgi:protein TonB